jgi:hypothetical protein
MFDIVRQPAPGAPSHRSICPRMRRTFSDRPQNETAMKLGRLVAFATVAVDLLLLFAPAQGADTRPKIVFIMVADDLENADLGYRGSDIKTRISTSSQAKACFTECPFARRCELS